MVLKSKNVYGVGLVEIRESSIAGWYALYVNGELKEQSADLSFIESEYSRIG